jgi:hypothetical protein
MKTKCFILLFFFFFIGITSALEININSGIILKGYFEKIGSNDDIYITVEYPVELYIKDLEETSRSFKVISDEFVDNYKINKINEEANSTERHSFFIIGVFELESDDYEAEVVFKIFDMIEDDNEYINEGLDFENMYNGVFNYFLAEGELFYAARPFQSLYMKIYNKIIYISINQYVVDNFKSIFEKNVSAKVKGIFTLQWMGRGSGALYDEDNDWSYRTNYGVYAIKNYEPH